MVITPTSTIARIGIEEPRRGTVLARVYGEIDLSSAPLLECAADSALDANCALVLDLEGVSFIGCSGLTVLAHTDRRLRRAGLRWALIANNHPVSRALDVAGLTCTLPLTLTINTAIDAIESPVPTPRRTRHRPASANR